MSEIKANGHKFGTGAADVVMVMIVFHSCKSVWILRRKSFTEHLCHDEDDEGSKEASASEEIYQGVTRGGKHGGYHQCDHM